MSEPIGCQTCGGVASFKAMSGRFRLYACLNGHVTKLGPEGAANALSRHKKKSQMSTKGVQVQDDLFKSPERARDEAIARVSESHDTWIERIALPVIIGLVRLGMPFTTDEVWAGIEVAPPEPRAMGAAMMAAKRKKLCRPSLEHRISKRPECHARPVRVWVPE